MVNAALENTTPVPVGAHRDDVARDRINDKLRIVTCKVVQALLNDVVAVQVLNELDHFILQRLDDHGHLLWCRDEFDHLL